MFQRIFVVLDRFEIKDKGIALTGITNDDSLRLQNGAKVIIKRPSLPDLEVDVLGFEVLRNCWSPNKPRNFALLIPATVGIEAVPSKSEIWGNV